MRVPSNYGITMGRNTGVRRVLAMQVMGNLDGDFEDEASIDEDDNTDGGDVSRAGSDSGGGAGYGGAGAGGAGGGYGAGYDQAGYMNGGMVRAASPCVVSGPSTCEPRPDWRRRCLVRDWHLNYRVYTPEGSSCRYGRILRIAHVSRLQSLTIAALSPPSGTRNPQEDDDGGHFIQDDDDDDNNF
jgi:hypothetical protein